MLILDKLAKSWIPREYGDAHHDGKKPADNRPDNKLVNHPLLFVLHPLDFVQVQHVSLSIFSIIVLIFYEFT